MSKKSSFVNFWGSWGNRIWYFFSLPVFHGWYNHKSSTGPFIPFQMNHTDDEYLKLVTAKISTLLAIGVLSFLCGILPYYSIRTFRNRFPMAIAQKVISGVICFSAGTLLGVTFLHLLPEVREKIGRFQANKRLKFTENLPLSDIIAMAGFFGVYLLDELLHMCVEWYSLRIKRRKTRTKLNSKETGGLSSEKVCTQLPHDISVFSLDKHENSKHQVVICRRSNHHTTPAPTCVCQTPKDLPVEVDVSLVTHNSEDAIEKPEGSSKTDQKPEGEFLNNKKTQFLTFVSGLITIAALSFHDIFEGIAIGIEQDVHSIVFLFLSIASHKYAIAFCIGMDLVMAGSRLKMIVLSMMTFSIVSPIGVIIGMIVVSENSGEAKYQIDSPASVVMQGIAGGTLIYVVCFEVLQREGTDTHKKGILNVMFVICGFLITLWFKLLTGHKNASR